MFAPCEGCWRRRDLSLWRGAVWLCRGCVPREGGPSWLARVAERLVERLLGTKGAGFGE